MKRKEHFMSFEKQVKKYIESDTSIFLPMVFMLTMSLFVTTIGFYYILPFKADITLGGWNTGISIFGYLIAFAGALGFVQLTAKLVIQLGMQAEEILNGKTYNQLTLRQQEQYNTLYYYRVGIILFIAVYETILSAMNSYISAIDGMLYLPKWALPFNDLEVVDTIYHLYIVAAIGICVYFFGELYVMSKRKLTDTEAIKPIIVPEDESKSKKELAEARKEARELKEKLLAFESLKPILLESYNNMDKRKIKKEDKPFWDKII
jgi:hypothetical protein